MPVGPTAAYAIDCEVNSYRGVLAVRATGGAARTVTEDQFASAREELARQGIWCEVSSAAGLAGLRAHGPDPAGEDGPVVCVVTSSGYKDVATGRDPVVAADADWKTVRALLER
ncbi:threonine synthase [Streptomyces filamentosus]